MFPFWKDVVAPILDAARARRIVEVGALRGENTELMLHLLGPDAELHVVDPVPDFDPAEHEERFAGQYVFHRDLSVNVLGDLGPMDAALLDGDHNWYTVFTELRLLARAARAGGAPLPLCVLHDVCWPYGRRDLYYDPSNVPDEHRQPWQRKGMRPGHKHLMPGGGGMNSALANAEIEGGPHNGVMTGIEDFIAQYDKPLRLVVLPIYFGLAILVEQERLARQPALAAALDRLESPDGKDALLQLSEDIRLEAVIFDQALIKLRDDRGDRLAQRYLDTVKSGILNDHHLETEVRLRDILETLARGGKPNPDALRDPVRNSTRTTQLLQQRHSSGEQLPLQTGARPEHLVFDEGLTHQGYASSGRVGLDHLHECLDAVWASRTRGDVAVVGVGLGGSAVFLAAYLEAYDLEQRKQQRRKLWLVDRFLSGPDTADLNQAREALARFDLLDNRTRLLQGEPAATLADVDADQLALLHIGPGMAADIEMILAHLYPRLAPGGIVMIDDITDPDAGAAVASYRTRHGITTPTNRVGRAQLHWCKEEELGEPSEPVDPVATGSTGSSRSPLARPAEMRAPDLSVVVVVHNMRREAMRTLHALSRRYQQDIDDLRYEVIVVENGSDAEQRLGEALVAGFGREFRYHDLGEDAQPSPVHALNRGIALASGKAFALMIDGAHVVTPRVLHYGMTALAAYAPAVVATQQWYVGPGQQGEVMRSGYDQAAEDALFDQVHWPDDGYRLFEIGHFVSDRDWFDGVWESNCLFVPRALIEQVGGFDEGFAVPGGGFSNLDLYERVASSPDVRVVSILGEGSFHQVHGGTTTNLQDPLERRSRVSSYAAEFANMRGRSFMGPEKPIHFVGGFHAESAKRTRSRRMTATAFAVDIELEGIDGPGRAPAIPIADDLRNTFTNAYFRSLAWRETTWIGEPLENAPTDLMTYQEIVNDVRPDWIVETGTGRGGRAFFLATICDLIGHGRVLSIDAKTAPSLPAHGRITFLTGRADDPDVVQRARDTVGPDAKVLVILGSRTRRERTRKEFDAYAPLVALGSYVIVEHTVLNGFPIDASFGPGPHEALRRIMNVRDDFLADTEREKHGLTFNQGGFLRRIK